MFFAIESNKKQQRCVIKISKKKKNVWRSNEGNKINITTERKKRNVKTNR